MAWSRALTRLAAGGLDIAIQELDWATVQTVSPPGARYPVVAVANLCANSEACFFTAETLQARRALRLIKSNIATGGRLILNADDFALSDDGDLTEEPHGVVRSVLGFLGNELDTDVPVAIQTAPTGSDGLNVAWAKRYRLLRDEAQRRPP